MGLSTSVAITNPANARANVAMAAVTRMLDQVVASAEPSVVFTSAVRLAVPLICDAATVTITEADLPKYAVSWPREIDEDYDVAEYATVSTTITGSPVLDHPRYAGTLALHFVTAPRQHHAVLAQLIVERATALIHGERLTESAMAAKTQAANLELALVTNRVVGAAIGILMSVHKVTSEQAFDLLRRASQLTQRKLHDIAVEVTETGVLDPSPAPSADPSRAPRSAAAHPSTRLVIHCAS
jgi:hypothetical protein